jgi:O-antigen/teichoic acid export membrane protein
MPDNIPDAKPVRFRVAANTVSQIACKFFSAAATFIVSFLVARMYGATGYGDFTKITTFVAVFYLFSDFGINAIYLRTVSRDSGADRTVEWQALLTARILISLFYIFICLAILVFLPSGENQGYTNLVKIGILLYAPSILVQALITSANAVFQEHLRYDLAAISAVAGSLVSVLLIWLVTVLYLPQIAVVASVAAILAGGSVTAVMALWATGKYVRLNIAWDISRMRKLIVASVPVGITLIFNVIYFRADSFILAITRPTEELGIYGLAYKIFEFPLVLPVFFVNSIYPILLARISRGIQTAEFLKLIRKSAVILLAGSVVITLALWVLSPFLTLVRPEFENSVTPLRILGLGMPLFFLSNLTMWIMIALKKQVALVAIYGLSMLFNIAANIYMIPAYGYNAAAWITVASEGLILVAGGSYILGKLRIKKQ